MDFRGLEYFFYFIFINVYFYLRAKSTLRGLSLRGILWVFSMRFGTIQRVSFIS